MKIHSRGKYKDIILPSHPYADKRGRVSLHRYLVEQKIGRFLSSDEIVHHIDGNRNNNDINNLEITTLSEHTKRHGSTGRTYLVLICEYCGKKFKREKREIHKGKNFCCRSHSSLYYGKKRKRVSCIKEISHGTEMGYRKKCRCDACKKAHAIKAVNDNKKRKYWDVAQLVERRTLVPNVEGSSPSIPALQNGA